VADIALDYDDFLDSAGSPWRRRLLIVGLVIVIAAVAAYFAWAHWMRGGASAAAPVFTEATVGSGNVTKTISTSGTVSADKTSNLNFSSSGKVTKVDVTLGQTVKQGDVLAEIDPTDAQNALKNAQAGLASAQAHLQTLLQGSTASELIGADQSVAQAQSSYDKAVQALNDLKAPPAAVDVEAAQQAVTAAQAQLLQAQEKRAQLDTDSSAAVASAQQAVQKAQDALSGAELAQSNAAATMSSTQASLYNAESSYCAGASVLAAFCSGQTAPISSADQTTLVGVTTSGTPGEAQLASAVLSANTAYTKALSDKQTADSNVDSAQQGLQSAQDTLTTAEQGPSAGDVAAADAAVSAAQVALDTANQKLADLQAGPTQDDLSNAQSAVDQAALALKSAQAKRDETYAGSTAADIQSQRNAVEQAQIAVDNAQKTVDETKLTAPFDGTVAALNIQVGDTAGAGGTSGSSSSSAAIVLNTPSQLVLNLTIAETDYPSVKVGDTGTVTFSALSGEIFPFVIDSIGANPTTTQGVVTYPARAHLVTGQQAAQILSSLANFGGRNRQGAAAGATPGADATAGAARTPRAVRTPSVGATPGASGTAPGAPGAARAGAAGAFAQAFANQQQPAPGMSATATIIVDQRINVITVPLKAVQTKNRQTVVTVKNADGSTQDVPVVTGLSDSTNTEITSGLTEGQTIEVPGTTATTASAASALPATGGFGRAGGGGFFAGGGGGGRAGD
jgi:HlyD family secretion protein